MPGSESSEFPRGNPWTGKRPDWGPSGERRRTSGKLTILPFDESAARLFENLKRQRLRCGTMDLKIAAICLVHDGLLLTRNLSDFAKVPGLRAENWLD